VQNEVRQRTSRARELRRESTEAERRLWKHLFEFYADFFCECANLIVELDGGHHASQMERDEERTRILQAAGIRVRRFWNNDVLSNIEGVLAEIASIAKGATPHPVPLPLGEGTLLQPDRHETWR
jgi:very-short-patch-repair endonuclease